MSERVDWQAEALALARSVDDLLVLFALHREDYNAVQDALLHLGRLRAAHPALPLSVRTATELRRRGLLDVASPGAHAHEEPQP